MSGECWVKARFSTGTLLGEHCTEVEENVAAITINCDEDSHRACIELKKRVCNE